MSDADEWSYNCRICAKETPCILDSDEHKRAVCSACMADHNFCAGSGLLLSPSTQTCWVCGTGFPGSWSRTAVLHVRPLKLPPIKEVIGDVVANKRPKNEKEKSMSAKLYVITKVGWEYNDEYYHRPDSEGGTPIKAYRTKEKAEDECDRLNGKWLRTEGKDMSTEDNDEPMIGYEVVEVDEEE